MKLLDGRIASKARLQALAQKVQSLSGRRPGLHVIRVGEDPASKVYVHKKIKTCEQIGFQSKEWHFSEKVSQTELLSLIQELNENPEVDGILIQLPLPGHLQPDLLLEALDPQKDVDGFHPYNLGKLMAREPGPRACTPLGIMNLLDFYEISVAGLRAVVIGRSRIVGRPMSLLLDHAGATVTVVHLQTQEPEKICREADLIVVACGVPKMFGPDRVKKGAVVVDVGIHRLADGKLCGDVDFEAVSPLCSWISPVPGGVGPMTICSLLENTFESFSAREASRPSSDREHS